MSREKFASLNVQNILGGRTVLQTDQRQSLPDMHCIKPLIQVGLNSKAEHLPTCYNTWLLVRTVNTELPSEHATDAPGKGQRRKLKSSH